MHSLLFLLISLSLHSVLALPSLVERQAVTTLSQAQIDAFTNYTIFATTAGCSPSTTLTWTCGSSCDKLSGFKPIASGGDGAIVHYWYVGYYPPWSSLVVVYQGTDASKIIPILTDLNIVLATPSQTYFPGLPTAAKVHNGFLSSFLNSQSAVLSAINQGVTTYGTKKITLIGNSEGGAQAIIAAASFKLRLGSSYTFKVVGYGVPRPGNQDWATWVDNNLTDLTHINNKHDPVPVLPPKLIGYVGTNGEIHIGDDNNWYGCPGDDNSASQCINAYVGLTNANYTDHQGPYNGIYLTGCPTT